VPITVNPRYGPMRNTYCTGYLFNTHNYCNVDGGYGYTLLTYSDSTFSTVDNCFVSTSDIGMLPNIITAPNPTTGRVQLLNLPNGATVHCYDALGRLVTPPIVSGDIVDLSTCSAGIYLVELRIDGQVVKRVRVLKIMTND
jgi:hypothetical protein